jgi:hypothetical protein
MREAGDGTAMDNLPARWIGLSASFPEQPLLTDAVSLRCCRNDPGAIWAFKIVKHNAR